MITVIGLGNDKDDLTTKGKQAIENAVKAGARIVVRTALTRSYQTVQTLGVAHICEKFSQGGNGRRRERRISR